MICGQLRSTPVGSLGSWEKVLEVGAGAARGALDVVAPQNKSGAAAPPPVMVVQAPAAPAPAPAPKKDNTMILVALGALLLLGDRK